MEPQRLQGLRKGRQEILVIGIAVSSLRTSRFSSRSLRLKYQHVTA